VRLAGVEAIVAEGFERIHRTNLIGMGVLPLEFKPGTTRLTLGMDGTETYDVEGKRTPRADLTLVIHRKNGERGRRAGDLPSRFTTKKSRSTKPVACCSALRKDFPGSNQGLRKADG
jgi:aconitase A